MTFGDDMTSTLIELRQMAEENMLDACIITRADPDAPAPEMNPETGQYPEPARIAVYEGKCRMQDADSDKDVNAGERRGKVEDQELQLPVLASVDVAVNDVVKVTDCVNDPSLVEREFTIIGRHGKSQATSRRLRMTEVTG